MHLHVKDVLYLSRKILSPTLCPQQILPSSSVPHLSFITFAEQVNNLNFLSVPVSPLVSYFVPPTHSLSLRPLSLRIFVSSHHPSSCLISLFVSLFSFVSLLFLPFLSLLFQFYFLNLRALFPSLPLRIFLYSCTSPLSLISYSSSITCPRIVWEGRISKQSKQQVTWPLPTQALASPDKSWDDPEVELPRPGSISSYPFLPYSSSSRLSPPSCRFSLIISLYLSTSFPLFSLSLFSFFTYLYLCINWVPHLPFFFSMQSKTEY